MFLKLGVGNNEVPIVTTLRGVISRETDQRVMEWDSTRLDRGISLVIRVINLKKSDG